MQHNLQMWCPFWMYMLFISSSACKIFVFAGYFYNSFSNLLGFSWGAAELRSPVRGVASGAEGRGQGRGEGSVRSWGFKSHSLSSWKHILTWTHHKLTSLWSFLHHWYFKHQKIIEGMNAMDNMTADYSQDDYEETNSSMCDFNEWEPSYSLIPVLYMLIFILGLTGNGVVIFTVWRAQSKRRAADIYIGNLAVADLTFVVTLPLWAVYTALEYHWPFGVALCKISSYVVLLNMYASVFCLTCLSLDRYMAIVHSLTSTQLRTRGHMRASLATIWLLSGVLAAPTLLFRTTVHDAETNYTSCAMDFSLVVSKPGQETFWIAGLSISSTALGFLIPLLAMMVCYGFIGCTVTRHFNSLRKEDQRKRRLLKIITTLVVVFAACWMPFHVVKTMDALSYLNLAPDSCTFLNLLLLAHPYATCLAYVNSCLNPFLYAFFDLRFRSQCLCLLNLKKALHASPASSLSSQKTEAQSLATKVWGGGRKGDADKSTTVTSFTQLLLGKSRLSFCIWLWELEEPASPIPGTKHWYSVNCKGERSVSEELDAVRLSWRPQADGSRPPLTAALQTCGLGRMSEGFSAFLLVASGAS